MKKVIVLTHGELSKGFASAYKVIAVEEDAFTAICVSAEDSPETVSERIAGELAKCGQEDPIIVLTDIAAGSTTRCIIPFLETYRNLFIVTGMNLALLLAVMMNPMEENIGEALRSAIAESKESLLFINDQLNES